MQTEGRSETSNCLLKWKTGGLNGDPSKLQKDQRTIDTDILDLLSKLLCEVAPYKENWAYLA